MKSNHALDWKKKFQNYMQLYGGRLIQLYDLGDYDVGVYVFLITRKWYTDDYQLSKNAITNELNSFPSYFLKSKGKFDPRKVEASLIKLVNRGFVSKCKNHPKKKEGHRPPDYIYESKDLTEVQSDIEKQLEETRTDMLNLLKELGNVEEDSLHYKNELERKNEQN